MEGTRAVQISVLHQLAHRYIKSKMMRGAPSLWAAPPPPPGVLTKPQFGIGKEGVLSAEINPKNQPAPLWIVSVIKWDERAYGAYEWPQGYFS
jgi:hypothetical protein